ncbi:radical SAM family heme chaperone HemW [Mumia sp. zg.B53]|uniref:radical SAM family heme chaperone HemW n=1 Tax=unclassified Mumia TaxID=2621872 RepID=UPI001C6E433A|nr:MULTISPECIES: radical SAM family heme chaperone HemW [unclassified Mumia]MBW9215842.1 radical SAM family heme chaperone HemW [Mumia sp. zg.B53]MDD9350271.1 radical SAM family heme chaperone HemW [Mumia sp.]
MPSTLPEGQAVPADGALPAASLDALGGAPFGVYVHVPFCVTRCGYCDFNTYTSSELGPGASHDSYADTVLAEIALAAQVLQRADRPLPEVETVFIGGGTPTLLASDDLGRILEGIDKTFGLAAGYEATTEANPDSVTPASLATLRSRGFTRISYGMQSAVPHVLATLDRTHDPARLPDVVRWARDAGFSQVSVDLIYGTPGESLADWERSLDTALALGPDHVSAYALIVEEGTALARRVSRGEVAAPDDDLMADMYLAADARLSAAGLGWYELSNWARDDAARCRHNELYWTGADWWGFGPGAHSHVAGTRWWNVKHPAAYAQRLAEGRSPGHGREILDLETRRVEQVLLESRLHDGMPLVRLDAAGRAAVPGLVSDGLVELSDDSHRLVLTVRGRLLADAVVRRLLP